jgi:hypothetical protein
MPDETAEPRRIQWSDLLPFLPLFTGFKLARDVKKIVLAAAAIVVIYLAGRVLDSIWAKDHRVLVADGTSELQVFVSSGFSKAATNDWIASHAKDRGSKRSGVFAVLLSHMRTVAHDLTSATLSLSPTGVVRAVVNAAGAKAWLAVMHPLYALLFLILIWLPVWAFSGAAICRIAALEATREDRLPIGKSLAFARQKFWSFVAAPLLPIGVVIIIGALMFIGGAIGAIPGFGTFVAPLFLFLAIIGGIVIALIVIGLSLGAPLMYPTIAVEGSDAFDAVSRSFSFVGERIWRTLLYGGIALLYGAICFVFVKLVARLALFSVHFFVGLSMNWGSARGPAGDIPHKLTALWQAPALDFSTPFYGSFDHSDVSGWSAFGRFLIALWVYGVFALVAGFLLSYYHSASTLMYLLLRRDVDATDIQEVFVEEEPTPPAAGGQPAAAPDEKPAATPGSLASLPVVGQTAPHDEHQ